MNAVTRPRRIDSRSAASILCRRKLQPAPLAAPSTFRSVPRPNCGDEISRPVFACRRNAGDRARRPPDEWAPTVARGGGGPTPGWGRAMRSRRCATTLESRPTCAKRRWSSRRPTSASAITEAAPAAANDNRRCHATEVAAGADGRPWIVRLPGIARAAGAPSDKSAGTRIIMVRPGNRMSRTALSNSVRNRDRSGRGAVACASVDRAFRICGTLPAA